MITRLFRLERNMDYEDEFNKVGENNLLTSHKVEPGTLAMFSTHDPDDPKTCYVFEVYADDDAYNVHAASKQFGAFVELAGKALTGRAVFTLVPRLMLEKPEEICVTGETAIEPHLVFVDIEPGSEEQFLSAITANMSKAIDVEPGVLVMYAATLDDNPNRWVFWEVYASAEAYAAHRETQHFKDYIAATDDIVTGKEFHVLKADTLVSKGSLH